MQQKIYKSFFIILLIFSFMLIFYAINNKINLFYSPEEILLNKKLIGKEIKLGGIVKNGSINYYDNLSINFIITDYRHNILVKYTGVVPDLFREHQGIVVTGTLLDINTLNAHKILAKHDEKYIPNH